jgi:hypothetical protein
MLELLERIHPIATACLLLMSIILIVYAWRNRAIPGARRIGALWLVPTLIELAYWIAYLNGKY